MLEIFGTFKIQCKNVRIVIYKFLLICTMKIVIIHSLFMTFELWVLTVIDCPKIAGAKGP